MISKSKQRLITALKIGIPIGIVVFLVSQIEQEKWDQLAQQPKDYGLLLAALVVAMAALTLSFVRWCVLVRAQEIELSMTEALRLGSICFLLSFVSAGSVGGDVFKAIFLAKRRPGKRVAAVASVFVDRGSGLYGLLLLVTLGLMISPEVSMEGIPSDGTATDGGGDGINIDQIKWITAILIGIGTTVLGILILGGRSVDRLILWGGELPAVGRVISTVGPPLRMFHHHPIAFGVSVLMSLGVQGMLVVSMYLIAKGLYSEHPTLSEHFVIVPIGMLASAIPITPGGVGVLEATIGKMYQLVPAVPTAASGVLVALAFEMVKLLMAAIGTVFYWTAGEEVRDSLEEAEQGDPSENDQ